MTRTVSAFIGAVLMAGAIGVASAAEQLPEVQVSAARVFEKHVGHTASGVNITDASVNYGVSYADLNLAQHADVLKLQQRVKDAALKACKDLHKLYPFGVNNPPTDEECAKTAADKTLAKVDELAAAAAARK